MTKTTRKPDSRTYQIANVQNGWFLRRDNQYCTWSDTYENLSKVAREIRIYNRVRVLDGHWDNSYQTTMRYYPR